MTFTITPLLSGGSLIEGTDSKGNNGTTILQSDRWDAVQAIRTHQFASEEFDAAVKVFFEPLTTAADAAKAAIAGPTSELASVTITKGVEGVQAQVIELDEQGILLRMLAEGRHDQLRWIENGSRLVAVQ